MNLTKVAKQLDTLVGAPGSAPKKKKKTKEIKKEIKVEDDAVPAIKEEGHVRRSRRLQIKQENPVEDEEETAEERFERQLGEFIVNGECPKCGNVYERGQKRHLMNCSGPKSAASVYAAKDRELLKQMTEEERKDERKKMLARMQAVALDGLVECNDEFASFIVIGSRGDPYTITLSDEKKKCTCIDHRCRKRDCKHILLVLSQLGILDEAETWEQGSTWREAVEAHLKDLIKIEEDTKDGIPRTIPVDTNAEIAAKFL